MHLWSPKIDNTPKFYKGNLQKKIKKIFYAMYKMILFTNF